MTRHPTTIQPRQRGFTLLEIQISLVLFSGVVLGLTMFILSATRSRDNTGRITRAQTSLRSSIDFIARDIQMAGAGARSGRIVDSLAAQAERLPVVVVDRSNDTDQLHLTLVDPSGQATLLQPFSSGQSTLSISSGNGLNAGDMIQVSDLSAAYLVKVTSLREAALAGSTITLAQIQATQNAMPVSSYPQGSYIFRSRRVAYFIDRTIFGGELPVLMLDPDDDGPQPAEPLAEGVEDFQVALGIDSNGDGQIRELGKTANDDEWIFNVAGEVAPASLSGLRAVRITLIVRTSTPEQAYRGYRPSAENHPGNHAIDGYPRRSIRTEISLRNMNL